MFGAMQSIAAVLVGRSPKWPRVRKAHLATRPKCVACGHKASQVHHVVSVKKDRTRELDPTNLASVCKWCHFAIGHRCDWSDLNELFWETVAVISQQRG